MSQVDTPTYNFVYRVVFFVGLVTLAAASGWVADATLYFSTFAVGIFVGGLSSELSYRSPPDPAVRALR